MTSNCVVLIVSNQHQLQNDLNSLSCRFDTNLMSLNIKQCKCMSFYRRFLIPSSCSLHNSPLEFVNSFSDLGIGVDPKHTFNNQIDCIINKARSFFGFVKRWSKELNDPYIT